MTQKLEIFIISVISLTFAFLAGVKYADSVKESIGWIFEVREGDVELPDLSKESITDSTIEDQDVILQDGISTQHPQQKKAISQSIAIPKASGANNSGVDKSGNQIDVIEKKQIEQGGYGEDEILNER